LHCQVNDIVHTAELCSFTTADHTFPSAISEDPMGTHLLYMAVQKSTTESPAQYIPYH